MVALSQQVREKAVAVVFLMETIVAEAAKNCDGKVFCPTGSGGGIDPTCSPGENQVESAGTSRVLFEVAPDPTDEKLSSRWNSLSEREKSDISHTVIKEILPRVFEAAGVHAVIHDQFGGYLDDTSPSFAAVIDAGTSAKDVLGAAKLAGFALSQKSMMVLSETEFAGADKVGVITIDLPKDMGLSATHQIYKSLRSIDNGVIEGHTTVGGQMAIVDFSGDTQGLADKAHDVLGGLYNVSDAVGYVSFPQKEEYNYDENTREVAGLAARREDARSLRAEASGLLDSELKKRGKAAVIGGRKRKEYSGAGIERGLSSEARTKATHVVSLMSQVLEEASKVFCPTGPGGGVDPTCSLGSAHGYEHTQNFKGKPAYDNGVDTEGQYRHADGTWTKERQELHDAILKQIMQGVSPVDKPVVYFTGGGSASGKSTALKAGLVGAPKENVVHIDADRIKEQLPEYKRLLEEKSKVAAAFVHEESAYLSRQAIKLAGAQPRNVVYDSVGDSGIEKLSAKVAELRKAGASVNATYTTNDVSLALKLAEDRYQKTGRYVSAPVLRENHVQVTRTVQDALARGLFDDFKLVDTNIKDTPRIVATAKGSDLTIVDQSLWDSFVAKGK